MSACPVHLAGRGDIARWAGRAATALVLAIASACPALAALPEWVQTIADSAPPPPVEASSQSSRVLLSETSIVVQADGTVRQRRRFAAQALSARTSDVSTGFFSFDESTHVTTTLAWHLPPGEDRARRDRSVAIDWTHDDVFLSDNRVRVKRIDGVKKGSLVFFEFEAAGRPPFLSLQHLFYEGAPTALDRFQVQLPADWSLRPSWVHARGPEPVVAGTTWTWEMRDLAVATRPPLADEAVDVAPRLFVQPVPPSGAAPKGVAAFADWAALSTWYDTLGRDRDAVTPAITTAAQKQSPGEQAAFLDRVRSAALFVRDSVRYTAIELGIGGYQPRPAADTLVNLYGDCKDKGTLFRSLLKAQGIPSLPVLVYLGDVDQVPEVAAWAFNHYVVAVPVPDGAIPAGTRLPALLDVGPAGHVLIVDTTDERTAFGSISAALGGHRALLVDGNAGRLVTLPEAGPEVSVITRRVAVESAADGSRVLSCEVRRRGEPAASARSEHSRGSLDRRRRVEERLLVRWPDATLADYAVVPENQDGEFEERIVVSLRPARGEATPARLFPWLGEEVPDLSLSRRTVDVVFPHAMTVVDETTVKGAFAVPPAGTSASGDGWSVKVSYEAQGDLLKANAEVVLSRRRFPPAAFPELKRFWSAVEAAAGRPIPAAGG